MYKQSLRLGERQLYATSALALAEVRRQHPELNADDLHQQLCQDYGSMSKREVHDALAQRLEQVSSQASLRFLGSF